MPAFELTRLPQAAWVVRARLRTIQRRCGADGGCRPEDTRRWKAQASLYGRCTAARSSFFNFIVAETALVASRAAGTLVGR